MSNVKAKSRHAYLIMAHNEFDFLVELLRDLDDERNDIYLHIDRKVKNYPRDHFEQAVARGKLYIIDPIKVNWGGYTQIACELLLMEKSVAHGPYAYYHILTGVTFPLKSQNEIHQFFDEHQGSEFVGFDNEFDYSNRLRNIHLFNEIGKINTRWKKMLHRMRNQFLKLQQHTDFCTKYARGYVVKKGLVYWSITEDVVFYLLSQKELIQRMFRYSICGDEVFVQTLLFNSPFKERLFIEKLELDACMRDVKPSLSYSKFLPYKFRNMQENVYTFADMASMLESNRLFAMKFGGPEAVKLVREFKSCRDIGIVKESIGT